MAGIPTEAMSGRNWMFMHTSKKDGDVNPEQMFRRWGIEDNKLKYLAMSTEDDEKTNTKYSLGWLQTGKIENDGQVRAFFTEGFLSLSVTDTAGKERDNEMFIEKVPKTEATLKKFGSYDEIATGPLINSGTIPENIGIEELYLLSLIDDMDEEEDLQESDDDPDKPEDKEDEDTFSNRSEYKL